MNLETNSKNKDNRELYRGINGFKKSYQSKTDIVKDQKGDLVADFHSFLARWRNYFLQLFNVHGDDDVRQTEIHRSAVTRCRLQVYVNDNVLQLNEH